MKKKTFIPVLALFALPLFSCGDNTTTPTTSIASSEASSVSSETPATSSKAVSSSEATASSSEVALSSETTSSSSEAQEAGLTISLFDKLPKSKSVEGGALDTCLFYPASEFDLGAKVTPNEALKDNIVVTIPEEHKNEIGYENGKLVTKNVYSALPFEITISVEGTELSLTQKVAVIPGCRYVLAKINDNLIATYEAERSSATSASYGMFNGLEKADDTPMDQNVEIAYFENEIITTESSRGNIYRKSVNRIEDGYYYNVVFNEDGATIDYDSSWKKPIGDGENEISNEKATNQVNRALYRNDQYGLSYIISDLVSEYELLDGGAEYFPETLRFDVNEDSDSRFSVDVVGNKPSQHGPFYMNVKLDFLFDSAKRITSFNLSLIYSDDKNPINEDIEPTSQNCMTELFNITYADKKSANPNPVSFREVALEPTSSEKVQRKISMVAEQLNKEEGERAANATFSIEGTSDMPYTMDTNITYYKNETIVDTHNRTVSGETTYESRNKTVTTIREGSFYTLNCDAESETYSVASSMAIGDGEGQISQADAIYQANHVQLDSTTFGLGSLLEEMFTMGVMDETRTEVGETVTFSNIKTTVTSDSHNKNSFDYVVYYSVTYPNSTESGTEMTMWYAGRVELSFDSATNGALRRAIMGLDIYIANPFDSDGNLKEDVNPDMTERIRMDVEYYKGNEKEANPNPIVF